MGKIGPSAHFGVAGVCEDGNGADVTVESG